MPDTKYFSKEITLSPHSEPAGARFPAKLAYWVFGSPSNPAVLMPTCYGGVIAETSPFLYSSADGNTDPPLPTDKFFIVVVGMLTGGESSSPSNTPPPWDGPRFPRVTYEDNMRLQHALVTEGLGLDRLFAYVGFSMGGQQAYHMAALYPDLAANVVVLAGSARTSWHNWSFLEGPRHALTTAHDFKDGEYAKEAPPRDGMRAFARVYVTWALSQAWFRQRCWEELGFATLQAYMDAYWGGDRGDANDRLAGLWMWQRGDIGLYYPEDGGDLARTLARIEARVLVMPSRTDAYFPPEDNEEEVKHLKHGELRVIESIWGHVAGGGGGTRADTEFMKREVKRFLGV